MSGTLKKILIIEDFHSFHSELASLLKDKVLILSAFTIEEAEKKFDDDANIDLITVDGCVPGEEINTEPLVRKFRETFKGPMVAACRSPYFRSLLKQAGCDHECSKNELPKKILQILGL